MRTNRSKIRKWSGFSMVLGCWLIAGIGFGVQQQGESESAGRTLTILITGGARGNLAPCGCTKPMSGGLNRLGTAVRKLLSSKDVIWVDLGENVTDTNRQSQLKLETYRQFLTDYGVSVRFLNSEEETLEAGFVNPNSSNRDQQILIPKSHSNQVVMGRGFAVAGSQVVAQALPVGLPILQYRESGSAESGSSPLDESILEVFDTDGVPVVSPRQSLRKGLRVSPGSKLRGLVVARWFQPSTGVGRWLDAREVPLESSVEPDRKTLQIYNQYLGKVRQEKLLEQVPKPSNDRYVGDAKCMSCHPKAAKVHRGSKHFVAMKSLINEKHDRDPDCVSCHVTGLDSKFGFDPKKSASQTLGHVGCESCHGPGAQHSQKPKVKTPFNSKKSCVNCHTATTSPKFNFAEYWKKIRH